MATYYFVATGAEEPGNSASRWSATAGGVGGAGVPGANDTAVITNGSVMFTDMTIGTLNCTMALGNVTVGLSGTCNIGNLNIANNPAGSITLNVVDNATLNLFGNVIDLQGATRYFTQGTDAKVIFFGTQDQSINWLFHGTEFSIAKAAGVLEFDNGTEESYPNNGITIKSDILRDPANIDPRSATTMELVIKSYSAVSLSGTICAATVKNYGKITLNSYTIDSHTVTLMATSHTIGPGTVRHSLDALTQAGLYPNTTFVSWAPAAPDTPIDVAATATSSTQVTVSWSVVLGVTYTIEMSPTGSGSWSVLSSTATASPLPVTGCQPNTTYYFRIKGTNAYGASGYSVVVNATTPVATLSTPTNLTAQAVSNSRVDLSWSSVSTATGYKVERSLDGLNEWTLVYNNPGTNYNNTGLTPGKKYYYRICATNSSGNSEWSQAISATTFPPTPTGFTATATGTRTIMASWNIESPATTFKVEWSLIGTENWVELSPTFDSSLLLSEFMPNTQYYFRVRAYNISGYSDYSAVINTTTFPLAGTPENLAAVAESSSQINLSWNASSYATRYTLERSSNGTGQWTTIHDGPEVSFNDSPLESDTTYYYRIRYVNDYNTSEWSQLVICTTHQPPQPQHDTSHSEAMMFTHLDSFRRVLYVSMFRTYWNEKDMPEMHYKLTDQNYAYENGSNLFLARIMNGADLTPLEISRVASIRYTVFMLDDYDAAKKTPIDGHDNVSLPAAGVLLASTRLDGHWDYDEIGYNFIHEPNVSSYPMYPQSGRNFRVEYRIKLTDKPNDIILRYRVRVI